MTDAPDGSTGTPEPHSAGGASRSVENSARFFAWLRSLQIVRTDDRWLGGVCGGIARRAGLNASTVRLVTFLLAILGGPVLLAYALCWALLPDTRGHIYAEGLVRGVFEPAIIAIAGLFALSFVPFTRGLWWQAPTGLWGLPAWFSSAFVITWSIAVTIGFVWLVIFLTLRLSAPATAETSPPAANAAGAASATDRSGDQSGPNVDSTSGSPRGDVAADIAADARAAAFTSASQSASQAWSEAWPPKATAAQRRGNRYPGAGFTAITVGIALSLGGTIGISALFASRTWSQAALLAGLAAALGVLATGIIVAGIMGRQSGSLGGIAFSVALALLFVGVLPPGTQRVLLGSPNWTVRADTETAGYFVAVGQPTLDLRRATGDVDVWVGVGETVLLLPAARTMRVETHTMVGGIDYTDAPATSIATNTFDSALEQGGIFFSDERTFGGTPSRATPVIRVWTLIGRVTAVTSRPESRLPESLAPESLAPKSLAPESLAPSSRSTSPTSSSNSSADAICEEFPCTTR